MDFIYSIYLRIYYSYEELLLLIAYIIWFVAFLIRRDLPLFIISIAVLVFTIPYIVIVSDNLLSGRIDRLSIERIFGTILVLLGIFGLKKSLGR
jgi:hypothetical protein